MTIVTDCTESCYFDNFREASDANFVIFCRFSTLVWCKLLIPFLVEDKETFTLHNQYCVCWLPGDCLWYRTMISQSRQSQITIYQTLVTSQKSCNSAPDTHWPGRQIVPYICSINLLLTINMLFQMICHAKRLRNTTQIIFVHFFLGPSWVHWHSAPSGRNKIWLINYSAVMRRSWFTTIASHLSISAMRILW